MSDNIPTPADVAKAAESQADPHTEQAVEQPGETETVEHWRNMAKLQEKRAKENAEAAKRLAEIEEAQKTEAEKAAERVAAAEQRAADAEARALRREIALDPLGDGKHVLTAKDAALLDAITDEAAMRDLAARLATPAVRNGNSAPLEGDPPKQPLNDDRYAFVQGLVDRAG